MKKVSIEKVASRSVMALFLLTGMVSCNTSEEVQPEVIHYVEVKDVSRDTYFSIFNEKRSKVVTVTFQETLSNLAVVTFSSDTLFSKGSRFVIGIPTEANVIHSISALEGDSLFITYQPVRKPISGSVVIGVTFR